MAWKYDAVSLIALVESKPCIWDKNNEDSKNKLLRDKSWREIVECLDDGYMNMSKEEQKKTSDMIINKWMNIRDSFVRSMRSKTGQRPKKPYMYASHLLFLLKNSEPCDTDNYTYEENMENVEEEDGPSNPTSPEPWTPPASMVLDINNGETTRALLRQIKTTNKRELDSVENEILAELKKLKSIDRTDRELVLLSFLPYLRDMTETELLEFHMDTLCTIKRIKEKRNYLSASPTGSTVYYRNVVSNCSTSPAVLQSATTGSLENSPQNSHDNKFAPNYPL